MTRKKPEVEQVPLGAEFHDELQELLTKAEEVKLITHKPKAIPKFCPWCGTKLEGSNDICEICGEKID